MTDRTDLFRVLVIGTGNSARSQIAEALILTRGEKRPMGRVIAESCGTKPSVQINEYGIVALMTHGIGWARHKPKPIDAFAGERIDLVITVCDHARAVVGAFPGAKAQVHWGLADPSEHIASATARAAFAGTCNALVARVNALLRLPLETMSAAELQEQAQAVHDGLLAPSQRSSARLRRPT